MVLMVRRMSRLRSRKRLAGRLGLETLEQRHLLTAVLQVELSHARREISYLHRELAQIQSELDQAHQIFEQIEKHPIAGPIVRIRQKMLDLMAAIRKRKNKLDSTCPAMVAKPAESTTESPLNQ